MQVQNIQNCVKTNRIKHLIGKLLRPERGLKNSYKALRIVKMGLSIHPDNKKLRNALMQCLTEVGKLQSAKIVLSNILNTKEEISDQLMFDIQFIGEGYKLLDSEVLKDMAEDWEKQKLKDGIQNVWTDYIRTPRKRRKIRVGYMSQDFCDHPRKVYKTNNKGS